MSKHFVAVIDGVIQDTYDCSRDETRCVYGYYLFTNKPKHEFTGLVDRNDVGDVIAPVPTVDKKKAKMQAKLDAILKREKNWTSKFKRAETALKKIRKQLKYYNNKLEGKKLTK